jgi:hypothetical protein
VSNPNNKLEILQSRIVQYDIRFPVATFEKELGFDKGYISAVLKGKKPISDKFWSTFERKYPAKDGEKLSDNGNGATERNSLPGTATLQDLLNEKDQRIKDIETSRQKIESLLAEANEEKRQLIATLRENMRLQEQQLKTMEANLVRGHDEIKGLLFSSNKYWEDVLIGEVGLLSGKRKVVGKKAGISRPGK